QQRAAVTDAVAALAADVDRVIRTARRTRPTRALTPVADLVTVVDRRLAFWRVLARQQARPLGWVRPEADGLWGPVPPEELEAAADALLTGVAAAPARPGSASPSSARPPSERADGSGSGARRPGAAGSPSPSPGPRRRDGAPIPHLGPPVWKPVRPCGPCGGGRRSRPATVRVHQRA